MSFDTLESSNENSTVNDVNSLMSSCPMSRYENEQIILDKCKSKNACEHKKFYLCDCAYNIYKSKHPIFISTQIVRANVTNNMTITGVRFVKKNGIIYTQIRKAKLMPGGEIDSKTEKWKKINYSQNLNNTLSDEFIEINSHDKFINLDDVHCPSKNHVLTGVDQ
ncbi:hypothetical protein HCN44_003721 [Aphidius gifuensis]|uniref:Uncharacterized protein n=1 Tax=Aphidius gifuensis TaxID=684658 RepID=A0A835CN78_APHGI|nr:hypothetical protein HCN44_003721 [Aphidius gifuensis]